MPDYRNVSLKKYCSDLAARLPAPGGGSASALSSCLGASLISMVINFTLGKPKYAKYEKELKPLLKGSEGLRRKLLDLTQRDVTAYQGRDKAASLQVPLSVCRLSYEAIRLCPPLITKGNTYLLSDVAVAAVLLEAGFAAGRFNVEINLKDPVHRAKAAGIRKQLSRWARTVNATRKRTEEKVGQIIGR